MTEEADVLHRIAEEHGHLSKLFADIEGMYQRLSTTELDELERAELLRTAAGDLETALDEMLQHFEAEEQVLFVEIERNFPEMSAQIELLVQSHESIYSNTRLLQRLLVKEAKATKEDTTTALEVIQAVSHDVAQHAKAESKIYGEALGRLPSEERRSLLQQLKDL